MKYPSFKRTLEPAFVRVLPLFVYDAKRDVFVRRTAGYFQYARVVVYGGYIALALIRRRFGRIDQIRVEDVKLIPLDGFRRRVIVVVMRGVVLVPLVPGVHSVEVSRFPRFVLVVPPVKFSIAEIFLFDFAGERDVPILEFAHLFLRVSLRFEFFLEIIGFMLDFFWRFLFFLVFVFFFVVVVVARIDFSSFLPLHSFLLISSLLFQLLFELFFRKLLTSGGAQPAKIFGVFVFVDEDNHFLNIQ
mmetsp:Transcript_2255/g.8043  ORF Transcript_2255/g.8043 Transcript_2255/m.8043 type:complete len:245 (+) Transcript_2255:651-1385(+)